MLRSTSRRRLNECRHVTAWRAWTVRLDGCVGVKPDDLQLLRLWPAVSALPFRLEGRAEGPQGWFVAIRSGAGPVPGTVLSTGASSDCLTDQPPSATEPDKGGEGFR